MIAGVLWLPQISVRGHRVDTYWLVALLGALGMLLSGQVDPAALRQAMFAGSSINPLKILVLFLSMTALSIFLDEVGFFRYLANKTLTVAGCNQMRLFGILYLTVSVLTVFTSNDIIVLTFTPFLCYFARHAHISAWPYLVAEFIAANTMSMMLMIGNPTNIYIATSYQIPFLDYLLVMGLPTLASSAVAFFVLWLLFRAVLQKPIRVDVQQVEIRQKAFLILGLADLAVCTVVLAIGSYIGLELWLVACIAALVLFLSVGVVSWVQKQRPVELKQTLRRMPWPLVPFVLSMFVIILAISQNGVTGWLNECLGREHLVFRYGIASFLAANLINNIPMSVLFCSVMQSLSGGSLQEAVYATVAGSNLGAYFTPIGALAGMMWMSMLKQQGVKFRFLDFVRYGAAVSVPTLLVNLIVLQILL